jgi:hypothetical protein
MIKWIDKCELTANDSIILFRRTFDGDDGVDFVNGGTSEKRRVGTGEAAERNNVFIFNLSINLFG